jgi:hypothetical protein
MKKSCFVPLYVYKLFCTDGTYMLYYAENIEEAKKVGEKHGCVRVEKMD